jgi:hypothetical protein
MQKKDKDKVPFLMERRCDDSTGPENHLRRFFPYFVSAQLAQKHLVGAEKYSGGIGVFIHIGVWITVVALDAYLLNYRFDDANSMSNMLQTAALVTVSIAGATVVFCTILHWCRGPRGCLTTATSWIICWNEALLPPFVSSIILSNIRASLEFSKFLLFFVVFEPVDEVSHPNAASRDDKNVLIALVCLKYFGTSLTNAQHKFKVYDEMH